MTQAHTPLSNVKLRLRKTIALKVAFEVAVAFNRCDAAVCAKQKMDKEVNAV